MRPRHRDRLMADVERLARASALWYWFCLGDWDDDRDEQHMRDRALAEVGTIRDHGAALALLRASSTAQRHAAHALRRARLPLTGYDWMPVHGQPWLRAKTAGGA